MVRESAEEGRDAGSFESSVNYLFKNIAAQFLTCGDRLVHVVKMPASGQQVGEARRIGSDKVWSVKRRIGSTVLSDGLYTILLLKTFDSSRQRDRIGALVARPSLADLGFEHTDGTAEAFREHTKSAARGESDPFFGRPCQGAPCFRRVGAGESPRAARVVTY